MLCQKCGYLTHRLATMLAFTPEDRPARLPIGEVMTKVYCANKETRVFVCGWCVPDRYDIIPLKRKKNEKESEIKPDMAKQMAHIKELIQKLIKEY